MLGYNWDTVSDMMSVELPINVSKKKTKKLHTGPGLTPDTLASLKSVNFTKKLCLHLTNGILDFVGIACPFILCFKLLMQQLFHDKEL